MIWPWLTYHRTGWTIWYDLGGTIWLTFGSKSLNLNVNRVFLSTSIFMIWFTDCQSMSLFQYYLLIFPSSSIYIYSEGNVVNKLTDAIGIWSHIITSILVITFFDLFVIYMSSFVDEFVILGLKQASCTEYVRWVAFKWYFSYHSHGSPSQKYSATAM